MSLLIQLISFSKEFVALFKDEKFAVNSNIIYELRDRNVECFRDIQQFLKYRQCIEAALRFFAEHL